MAKVSAQKYFFIDDQDAPSKREILKVALHLFVRDGIRGTSIRDIGVASGYTNPVLYKFFDRKDALALHLFERCYQQLFMTIGTAFDKDQTFAHNVDAFVAANTRMIDDNLDAVLFVNENLRSFWPQTPAAVRRLSILGLVRRLLEHGQQEAVVAPHAKVDLLIIAVIGILGQFARALYFKEIEPPAADWASSLRDLLLRTIG